MSALQDQAASGAVHNAKRARRGLPVQVPPFGVVLCAQEVSGKHQDAVSLQHDVKGRAEKAYIRFFWWS